MKKNFEIHVFVIGLIVNSVIGFSGSEEKFIRKYAMMKVYESCFGSQVLKEIRKEMKEAAQKCAGFHLNFDDKYFTKNGNNIKQVSDWLQESTQRPKPSMGTKVKKPIHTTDTLLLQQWTEEQKQSINNADSSISVDRIQSELQSESSGDDEATSSVKKPVDFSKLEEAIMNIGKPSGLLETQKHGSSNSNFQQTPAVGYYPAMYYPPPVPFGPTYPYHAYYPGYFQTPGPAGSAAFQSFYRNGLRTAKVTSTIHVTTLMMPKGEEIGETSNIRRPLKARRNNPGRTCEDLQKCRESLIPRSKELLFRIMKTCYNFNPRNKKQAEVKPQIDLTSLQYSSKIRNVSCVMQELGYLDERLEPNYSRMTERINRLYISEELKKDMLDGVKFCKQFSQCLPDNDKDSFQLTKELLRPMFFFRCYKHKKLESCVMKDIRERFSQTTAELNNEVRRSFRNDDTIFESVFGQGVDELESLF